MDGGNYFPGFKLSRGSGTYFLHVFWAILSTSKQPDRKCSVAPGLKQILGPCCTSDLCPFSPSTTALAAIPVVQEAAGFPRPPAYCTRSFCGALGGRPEVQGPLCPAAFHTLMGPRLSGQGLHGQVLSWFSLVPGEVDNPGLWRTVILAQGISGSTHSPSFPAVPSNSTA